MAKKSSPKMTLGEERTLHIDTIKPYWRNPRQVSEEAINAVAQSIRDYGYQQPILVDAENVIIAGHTRYAAMRRLEVLDVPVRIANLTDAQAKRYRLIDNKTAEFTSWDFEALTEELGELDQDLMASFFPEIGLDEEHYAQAEDAEMKAAWSAVTTDTEFVCPACFHGWVADVSREDVLAGSIPASAAIDTPDEESA